jgi:hypothetical protein
LSLLYRKYAAPPIAKGAATVTAKPVAMPPPTTLPTAARPEVIPVAPNPVTAPEAATAPTDPTAPAAGRNSF